MDVAEADSLNCDDGEVETVDEIKMHDEGVYEGTERDVDEEYDDYDDEGALFACETTAYIQQRMRGETVIA